ncbi:Fe-S cluster protein [Candidatus Magnetomorum sp. HK-1]|nr:Fe-S cluster protein [Candidatus Magnetomorum sp. HK-1]
MALSIVDIYKTLLPKTNCKECGHPTCLAFASMVVSEKFPLKNCPYIDSVKLEAAQKELEAQYIEGKWTKKDMAEDALNWAKERAASMKISDLPERIGGRLIKDKKDETLELPYFTGYIFINDKNITHENGKDLTRWEQVFILNHMAQGGNKEPGGKWKGFQEFPNTVSKIKSMKEHVEAPLVKHFRGKTKELIDAGISIGGQVIQGEDVSADVSIVFRPLPKIPVMLNFWDEDTADNFEAEVKLLFDETIVDHLDIESIMFLSERIKQLLCGEEF